MIADRFPLDSLWLKLLTHKNPNEGMLLDFIQAYAERITTSLDRPETLAEWSARAESLRPRLLRSLGLVRFPDKNSPNPRITGTIESDSYRIEKVVFEPRPGFTATAHLYLPKQGDLPAPAVLYVPGHWMENGKLEPDIQIACANLARLGLVVLVYDPLGQGERLGSWRDHGHTELLLAGLSQEGLMVWESMRAIDYLVSREEVDPCRIGMTGASGGGLNTLYTCAIDERIQVSVPVCFVTTFLSMMTAERDRNWEDGVDLCNQVPGVMAYAEMSDLCALFAPKPLCLIAGRNDWMFPIQGTRQIYRETFRIYQWMKAATCLRLLEADAPHGYSREMREAAYGWFSFWLMGQGSGDPVPEQDCPLLTAPYPAALTYMYPPRMEDLTLLREAAELRLPSQGLCLEPGTKPDTGANITRLAKKTAADLPPRITEPLSKQDWLTMRPALVEKVGAVLGSFPKTGPLKDWFYRQGQTKDLFYERIEFESEDGIRIPSVFLAPLEWEQPLPVVLYLDEAGKENGLSNGLFHQILQAGWAVLAVDVRGTGEISVSDFEAATNALMTDRPLFGQQVWDVMRAVDELWQRTFIGIRLNKGRIACFGRGTAGLLALYATALDERIKASVLLESPLSYHSLLTEQPDFPASVFLFGVLENFDLPQVIALAAPRGLQLVNPVDGHRQRLSADQCERILCWPSKVYQLLGGGEEPLFKISETDRAACQAVVKFFKTKL